MQNNSNNIKLTLNEQDYLKAIFHLTVESNEKDVGTNGLAERLSLSPGSVNLMVKKIKSKNLVNYEKYGKISLTESGKKYAIKLIRKHRLWETFLCDYLKFTWDEVHQIAEQLEHIDSEKLIDKLEEYMDFPIKDPHGSPIPTKSGKYSAMQNRLLSDVKVNEIVKVVSINDDDENLLKYASKIGISLNSKITVKEIRTFDNSILIKLNEKDLQITEKFAQSIYVK